MLTVKAQTHSCSRTAPFKVWKTWSLLTAFLRYETLLLEVPGFENSNPVGSDTGGARAIHHVSLLQLHERIKAEKESVGQVPVLTHTIAINGGKAV